MKKYVDLKLLKILAIFYTITGALSLAKKAYLKINGYGFEMDTWPDIFIDSAIDWIIVMIFMTVISISAKVMLEKNVKWPIIISIHLFFSLFIGIILYFLSSIVYLITGQITVDEVDLASHFAGIISVIDLNFLIYISMISIVYSFYYFKEKRAAELEKSQLAHQLMNTRMNILQYKLHPHFLFNTLNSISTLIETDSKLAQNTVADFGDLLRDLLNLNDSNLIPLKDEVVISKRYLDIMALRFSDHLTVEVDIDEKMNSVLVPSLILLPIIENSIKHGYSYDVTNLNICLSIYRQKKDLVIEVKNNGAPLKSTKIKYGQGLQNTIDRLKILYKNNYTYHMTNLNENSGVITTISFPVQVAAKSE